VQYVHTKVLLIDPLSDAPVVVSGSANFSMASTRTNDENMLVLRGEGARRVAGMYLVEFLRVFTHFAPRDAVVARAERESGVSLRHLRTPLSAAEEEKVREALGKRDVGDGGCDGGGSGGDGSPLSPPAAADDTAWLREAFTEGSRRQVERLLFLGPATVAA